MLMINHFMHSSIASIKIGPKPLIIQENPVNKED